MAGALARQNDARRRTARDPATLEPNGADGPPGISSPESGSGHRGNGPLRLCRQPGRAVLRVGQCLSSQRITTHKTMTKTMPTPRPTRAPVTGRALGRAGRSARLRPRRRGGAGWRGRPRRTGSARRRPSVSWRIWTIAMMCRTRLSRRFPARESRCRCCWPEEASSGAVPVQEAKCALVCEAGDVADVTEDPGGADRAGADQPLGHVPADPVGSLRPPRPDPATGGPRRASAGNRPGRCRTGRRRAPSPARQRLRSSPTACADRLRA